MLNKQLVVLGLGLAAIAGAVACSDDPGTHDNPGGTAGNSGAANNAGTGAIPKGYSGNAGNGDSGGADQGASGGTSSGGANAGGSNSAGTSSGGSSGSTASGGSAGNGPGPDPIEPEAPGTRLTTASKVDVLFVVDNSVSMAGMPNIIGKSAGAFIKRLVNPRCVDGSGKPSANQPASGDDACPSGTTREFTPVKDMHIGAISSSLGGHGGDVCEGGTPPMDDKGRLLPTVRTGVKSWQNSGYLVWDSTGANGEKQPATLINDVSAMLVSAGSNGCGYEAQLESMYRFLVDPEPPLAIRVTGNTSAPEGIDQTVLDQRKSFLRGDSAVAIVLITDENDCSIRDDSLGWLVSKSRSGNSPFFLWRSTSVCQTDPNNPCCRSCATQESAGPPASCGKIEDDVECKKGATPNQAFYSSGEDKLNLRCWDQKRRFGFDLLYPTSRYVDALSRTMVTKRDGTKVPNPLFVPAPGKLPRSSRLISFTGIVGVPWQDVSNSITASPEALRVLDGNELANMNRWQVILGDPANNVPPSDPLMVETWQARSGVSPIVNQSLAPATSTNPQQNTVNGHEYKMPAPSGIEGPDDLQYACTFELETPKTCAPGEQACDCSPAHNGDATAVVDRNSPACQPPSGGPAGTTQYYAKAYPTLRPLSVLKALGERGIVGSVCPRTPKDLSKADYGYVPTLQTLSEHMAPFLK